MRDIDDEMAGEFIAHLDDDLQYSSSTINQYIFFMRLMWRCLAKPIRGPANPWNEIRKHRVIRREHRRHAVTPEQFRALVEAAATRGEQTSPAAGGQTLA